jgi:catechol 2,3-dioxygenase-like lactoylglutathione lyase family enzyme
MPITTGLNHVAFLTTDMERTVRFYEQAFEATLVHEVPRTDDHPWLKILDVGGGSMINVFQAEEGDLFGERRRPGKRGGVDHFGFQADSKATLEVLKGRLRDAGAEEVGEIQQLGGEWSLFFRDIDGLELEVLAHIDS